MKLQYAQPNIVPTKFAVKPALNSCIKQMENKAKNRELKIFFEQSKEKESM
jgi:hypothetical protein